MPLAVVAVALTLLVPPPKGATARCKDGSFYMGDSRSGACSGKGGVAQWLGKLDDGSPPPGATARCKDGSWYQGETRQGACSGKGGVKAWVGKLREK
ncbi:MAG: DUF3761 domain-containing protein [Gemmatimonadales bacterium]|nr:DUF3761 domain-containing protein [Gemmatimonadales bacterium]